MFFEDYQVRSKIIKRIIFWAVVIAGLLALFLLPTPIKAQDSVLLNNTPNISAQDNAEPLDPCQAFGGCIWQIQTYKKETMLESVGTFIFDVIYFLIFLAGAVTVVMLIFGSIRMITSSGNADIVKDARTTIINALIGLVLVILAITIVNILQTVLINLQLDFS